MNGLYSIRCRFSPVVLVTLLCLTFCSSAFAADLTIYDDSLAPEWESWSWSSDLNYSSTTPVHSGSNSIAVTPTSGWGALSLHTAPAINLAGYVKLRFWIHGGSSGQQLRVVVNDNDSAPYQIAAINAWTLFELPLAELGNPGTLVRINWQDTSGAIQPAFYLDDISLVAGEAPPPPPPGVGPAISIDTTQGRHSISEDIYGMNFADKTLASELRLPVNRRGGNSTSRYNWQIDVYNTGSDWFFENITEPHSSALPLPDDSSADLFVEQNSESGTKSILTVPMIGWVAKQRKTSHPFNCGFSIVKYGTQDDADWSYDPDCGNGVHNGINLSGNDPTDTSVSTSTSFVSNWITHLTGRYNTAANGGVAYYNLDNEPMLWNSTHRDVHPQPATYDEIRDRTYQYAPAIKAVDPSAKTLGPVLWGWCAYFYSALDNCGASNVDYAAHGNTYFVPWYLQQMKAYEQLHGVRILDYLDLHFYPQATGVALSPAGSASTQSLRLNTIRGLWDPTYRDESWINDYVRLIPRMKEWVNANYPGTKLAMTEYNWGGLEHINGALAQADILGIFGREGLDLATIWSAPEPDQPGAYAFRMYRNYDGAGHGFGETSVKTTSTNQGAVAVYAAQRSSDTALTLMFINKTSTDLTTPVTIAGTVMPGSASVYRYSPAAPGTIQHLPDQELNSNGFSTIFPANSITLMEIKAATYPLNVTVTGSGGGTVTSEPVGISCATSSLVGCGGNFTIDSTVTLLATPGTGSVFSGWGGACSGISPCDVTMDAIKDAFATFTAAPDVRVGTNSYLTLQDAYDSSTLSDNILLREGSRSGALLANRPIEVLIKGGYGTEFAAVPVTETVLEGGIIIRSGTVRIERIHIR